MAYRHFTLPRPWPRPDIHVTSLMFDTYLAQVGIAQGDRLSMANSVELRLPFVDYKLAETVVGLRKTRPAPGPGGLRRPLWMLRPVKPTAEAYRLD